MAAHMAGGWPAEGYGLVVRGEQCVNWAWRADDGPPGRDSAGGAGDGGRPFRAGSRHIRVAAHHRRGAGTIWGRYFPGFTEHEQRLHSEAAIRDAVRRTDGLTVAATQTFQHPRTSTAERLRAQAEGRHYSTFAFYTPQELRAAIAVFLARLPSPEVSWIDEHLLVIADRRRNHAEPDGPASPANQAITGRALQISARRSGQAPQAVPAAARRPPRNPPSRSLPTTFSRAIRRLRMRVAR